MTRMILYAVSVPEDAQTDAGSRIRANLSKQGVVNEGPPAVESISLDPGEYFIAGEYRGDLADVMAQEIEELFSNDNMGPVPYYGADGSRNAVRTEFDGYYSTENVNPKPVDPRARGYHHQFDGVIAREGTRKTHWRSVGVVPTQVENDFGSDQTALVGVPSSASKVRWVDRDNKTTTTSALVQSTVTGEFGDVDFYNARTPSYDRPALIYDLPYVNEAERDAKVWDDRGQADKEDGDGVVRWQRVFAADHDYDGQAVLDSGRLRLYFDEPNNSLSAESYSSGSWSSTALGTGGNAGNWQLWDLDVYSIGVVSVTAQTIWEDTTDGSLFHLNAELPRGYGGVLWYVPGNETPPAPSGLQTKLSPVADGQDFSARPSAGLVRRKEVRK